MPHLNVFNLIGLLFPVPQSRIKNINFFYVIPKSVDCVPHSFIWTFSYGNHGPLCFIVQMNYYGLFLSYCLIFFSSDDVSKYDVGFEAQKIRTRRKAPKGRL